jgi:hypothetical protein
MDVGVVCFKSREKGEMQDNHDKDTSPDEVQSIREHKRKNLGGGKDFAHPSSLAVGLTQPPMQWVSSFFCGAWR